MSPSATTVAVCGAGIAGLTVAHELNRLGYEVSVYEANPEAGGFFRSARLARNQFTPSDYSWRGFGPWYHNLSLIGRGGAATAAAPGLWPYQHVFPSY